MPPSNLTLQTAISNPPQFSYTVAQKNDPAQGNYFEWSGMEQPNTTVAYVSAGIQTYNPSVQGPVASLEISYDFKLIETHCVMGSCGSEILDHTFLLRQGDNYYVLDYTKLSGNTLWNNKPGNALQDNFVLLSGSRPKPDFSSSGGPFMMGFIVKLVNNNPNQQITWGIDHYNLIIHATMTPSPVVSFSVTPATSSPTAGVADQVMVQALDAGGHVVPGFRGTVHFTSNGAGAILPLDYTFTAADNGVHTFPVTFTAAGARIITVARAAGVVTGMATVNVLPAAANHFQIDSSATSTNAGAPLKLTVTARDKFNNVATNYRGIVHFTNTDPKADALPDYTFTAADNGVHTFPNVILRTAGSQILTATSGGSGIIGAIQNFITGNTYRYQGITAGPDGNLWFTEYGSVGWITPTGSDERATFGPFVSLEGITAGPDGNLWVTDLGDQTHLGGIFKITPAFFATGFVLPGFQSGSSVGLDRIAAGPDGNVWFTEKVANKVGRITPAGVITEFPLPPGNRSPQGITAGPDGYLGFTEAGGAMVGRPNPFGTDQQIPQSLTEFRIPTSGSAPYGITAGPDGNVWFVEGSGNKVGRITPSGTITEFPIPTSNSNPSAITAGPDGYLWFTEYNGQQVGRITSVTLTTGSATVNVGPALTARYAVAATALDPDIVGTPFDVTVTAQDSYGNTVTGYQGSVHFTSTDAAATLPADYTFTAADLGVHTFSGGVILRTPGSRSVSATGSGGIIPGSVTVNVVALVLAVTTSAANSDIAGTPFTVTVKAQDASGNTLTGYRGTVHFTSSDNQATLPADYTFTADDNGVHIFTGVVLRTAGSRSITATDMVTGSATVTVVAAAASQFVVSTSAANPDVAGTPFDVTVTARDAYGNTATGYTGTVHFSSADPYGAGLPADYTFQAGDRGVHTFPAGATLFTAGTWDVTATDTVANITGTANVNVIAAPASQFVVSTDAADPDIAGTVFDVTVTATDPYGNTDTNYTGTVTFSSQDPFGAMLPADYTFQPGDQGVVTFTGMTALYTAGTWDVTATDTGDPSITGAALVNVIAAPAVAFQIVAPASATSGVAFDVTVIAVDPYGNIDTNYTGTITFSTSDMDPGVVLPPDYTFQPEDAGMVTFPGGVTLVTLGDQTLTVTDTDSGITGTATVTVTSGMAPGAGGIGAKPGVSERPPSANVPTGTATLFAVAADRESGPARAQAVAATAHRAALIDHVWSDWSDPLLAGPWIDGLVLGEAS
jgi:streptogramin lyase